MKTLSAIILLFIGGNVFSQELLTYVDTLNGFSIGVPKGWTVQITNSIGPGIKIQVRDSNEKDIDEFRSNYNVNIVSFANSNIDASYLSLKAAISKRSGFQFLSEGDTTINKVKYRWLLEKHSNSQSMEQMKALIVLGYKNNYGYMVTFVTSELLFPNSEALFRRIASTFSL